MKRFTPLLALCLLAACDSGEPDATAGDITPNEARTVDEAAEMVEARRVPTEAQQPPASDFAPTAGPEAPK